MTLIADAGSTGTQWAAISPDGGDTLFECGPINPSVHSPEAVEATITEALKTNALQLEIDRIEFYGAGCRPGAPTAVVDRALRKLYPEACIEIHSDMLGACRGASGRNPAIVCILGTGSNACRYDGDKIVETSPSLGYILGDEGSGADIGKRLVNRACKHLLTKELSDAFFEFAGMETDAIIHRVYREPGANSFLASLAPFAYKNIGNAEIRSLVVDAFTDFFIRNIMTLLPKPMEPLCFVGSTAWWYRNELEEVAGNFGLAIANVVKSPLAGLMQLPRECGR